MKPALAVTLILLAAAQIPTASAQVYQWKDSSGRTIISDTPPPTNAKGSRTVNSSPAPSAASESAPAAPKTSAEKDMEFRKRQQEAKEKAEKDAKEQALVAQRKDACERATRHLAALEAGEPMATRSDSGERQLLNADQRQQEMERARSIMADSCK